MRRTLSVAKHAWTTTTKIWHQKLPVFARDELLDALTDAEVELRQGFRSTLVTTRAMECTDMFDVCRVLSPVAIADDVDTEWDARKPLLSKASLEPKEMATIMLDILVSKKLCPLICKGAEGVQEATALCTAISTMRDVLLQQTVVELDIFVSTAIEDLGTIVGGFFALTDAGPSYLQGLDDVQAIKVAQTGAKALLKHALVQTAFWKEKEKALRESVQAEASMGPDVRRTLTALNETEGLTIEMLKHVTMQIPKWRDHLKNSVTKPVMTILEQKVEVLTRTTLESASKDEQCKLLQVLNWAHSMVAKSEGTSCFAKSAREMERCMAQKHREGVRARVSAVLSAFVQKDLGDSSRTDTL
eukprot:967572-Amphidinium_carterae.1